MSSVDTMMQMLVGKTAAGTPAASAALLAPSTDTGMDTGSNFASILNAASDKTLVTTADGQTTSDAIAQANAEGTEFNILDGSNFLPSPAVDLNPSEVGPIDVYPVVSLSDGQTVPTFQGAENDIPGLTALPLGGEMAAVGNTVANTRQSAQANNAPQPAAVQLTMPQSAPQPAGLLNAADMAATEATQGLETATARVAAAGQAGEFATPVQAQAATPLTDTVYGTPASTGVSTAQTQAPSDVPLPSLAANAGTEAISSVPSPEIPVTSSPSMVAELTPAMPAAETASASTIAPAPVLRQSMAGNVDPAISGASVDNSQTAAQQSPLIAADISKQQMIAQTGKPSMPIDFSTVDAGGAQALSDQPQLQAALTRASQAGAPQATNTADASGTDAADIPEISLATPQEPKSRAKAKATPAQLAANTGTSANASTNTQPNTAQQPTPFSLPPQASPVAYTATGETPLAPLTPEGLTGQSDPQSAFGSIAAGLNSMKGEASGQAYTRSLMGGRPSPELARKITKDFGLEVTKAMRNGNQEFTMKMDPVELGRVTVRMQFSEGKMVTQVLAERPETLELLQRDVRGLERAIEAGSQKAGEIKIEFGLDQGNQQSAGKAFADALLEERAQQQMDRTAALFGDDGGADDLMDEIAEAIPLEEILASVTPETGIDVRI